MPVQRHDALHFRPVMLQWLPIALALIAATPACAQNLQAVFDAARAFDATYLGARALAESAEYRADQAHALRRPQIGLEVTTGRSRSDTPTQEARNTSTTAGINASQSLFNRADAKTIEQADRSLDAARADLEIAEQDLIVRVAQAYFDVLAAREAYAAAQANKTAISEQLASAKRNFEVGTATITDTREAQARFDLATAQEIAADNDLRTKRVALDQIVGRANVDPRGLALPTKLPALTAGTIDEWAARSEQAPIVRKATVGLDIAKLETEKARAQHLPTLDLNAGVSSGPGKSHGTQTEAGITFPYSISGTNTQSSVGLALKMPLFAGFATQNRVQETLKLEEQARNNLEAARRGTAQATRQAYYGVQSLQAQVLALEAAESSSQLALEATQLGYRVGVRVNLDVLNAQTQLFNTRRDLAKARYDTLINSLRLRQASGELAAADVAVINQLLRP